MSDITRSSKEKFIHKYNNDNGSYHFLLTKNANIQFGAIINQSNLSLTFDAIDERTEMNCYIIIPSGIGQNISLDIQSNLLANNTKIIVNIYALANDNSQITLNGNVHIGKRVSNTETRLFEETTLIGNAKYISLIPSLKVESPNVIASHGAKIQRIAPEKLFYMESRGLNENDSINMIVNSYINNVADQLQLNEKEKSDFYSMIQ